MSSRIQVLPDTLVDQIAAGEVVERPSSAVKELLENALDAGATRVEIDVDGGGLARIVVADDGGGMTREEAPLALERHATSKIRSAADLLKVGTYGFRGEALPSIASVSHFTLLTARGEGPEGTRVVIDGGRKVTVEPAPRPRGTTVTVLDLFANVPARRKFLRGADAERRRAVAVVTAMALVRPDVAFLVRADGRIALDLPVAPDRAARARAALGGAKVLGELLPVSLERLGISATGVVGTSLFPSRRSQYLFVRDRWVQDRALVRAVGRAEEEALRVGGRHPGLVLFVDLPPESVDVNVHPAKSEVRFRDGGKVFEVVFAAVRDALLRAKGESMAPSSARPGLGGRLLTPSPSSGGAASSPPSRLAERGFAATPRSLFGGGEGGAPGVGDAGGTQDVPSSVAGDDTFGPFRGGRFLGQFRDTYLVVDAGGELLLLDQHVAHERVLFEATLDRLRAGGLAAQRLIEPVVFEATPDESALLEARGADLERAGFGLRPMSGGAWGLTSVPDLLRGDPASVLREVLGKLPEEGDSDGGDAAEPLWQALAAKLACRAAIMAGDPVAPAEARRLVDDLSRTRDPWSCPHGRPSWISLDSVEVERRFGRR